MYRDDLNHVMYPTQSKKPVSHLSSHNSKAHKNTHIIRCGADAVDLNIIIFGGRNMRDEKWEFMLCLVSFILPVVTRNDSLCIKLHSTIANTLFDQ